MVWTLVGARGDAEDARADLRRTRDDLDARAFLDGDVVEELEAYAARMTAVGDRLDHPMLSPLRVLPVAGRQLSAARHQADAAAEGLEAAAAVGDRLRALVDDGGLGAGPARVETLRAIAATAESGRQAFVDLDLGPSDALVGPLTDGYDEIAQAQTEVIEALDRMHTTSTGLAEFFEGPSDYLLFAANNAQMQNGQGMFLSAGVLHVESGRMDLGPMESLESLPDVVPPVPLDADLAARWGWLDPNTDLRHLGLSARFPVTASTAAALWTALGNPELDGVVAVDPHMLAAIMRATGPVRTSVGERSPGDVVRFVLHDQYQGYLSNGTDTSYTERRRDELDELARAVLGDLEEVEDLDGEVLDRFRAAAGARHLLMWSADPGVQAAFEAAEVDGQVGPDSLLLSLVNRSGNKLDWFTQMAADLSVTPAGDGGDGGYDVAIDVSVTNEAPPSGEPRYVVGPYPGSGLERGEYLALVTLTLPAAATGSHVDGVDRLAVSGGDGPNRTIAAWVRIAPGTTTHVVVRFHLPASTRELRIEPSARTHPTAWSDGTRQWEDRAARTIRL